MEYKSQAKKISEYTKPTRNVHVDTKNRVAVTGEGIVSGCEMAKEDQLW